MKVVDLMLKHCWKILAVGITSLGLIWLLPFDSFAARGQTRTFYIAAEDVLWDYAPSYPINRVTGEEFTEGQKVFVEPNGKTRIGHNYWKGMYREYTDETFDTPQTQTRAPEWEHLGLLGPVIHASVGDTIVVVFRNNTADQSVSLHPHGLFYAKDSEGSPYNDGTSGEDKADDHIPPGEANTYVWKVPKRAGPGPNDPSSIVWLYHAHVHEPVGTNSGFVGPIVVTRRGMAKENGAPKDVDREVVNLFTVFDENASAYLDQNIAEFAPRAGPEDEGFRESNLMHAINGYVYGNLPGLDMKEGEKLRWYLIGLGTEVDLHTPHWHGNTVLSGGHRTDVIELLPASIKTVTMRPDNSGTWMYHCHVNDHIDAGMIALYTVDGQQRAPSGADAD